jgi:hypothetical protein
MFRRAGSAGNIATSMMLRQTLFSPARERITAKWKRSGVMEVGSGYKEDLQRPESLRLRCNYPTGLRETFD